MFNEPEIIPIPTPSFPLLFPLPTGRQPAIKRPLHSVCQHYRLLSLAFKKGKTLDFSGEVVQILPTSLWAASIFQQDTGGIFVPVSKTELGDMGEVRELCYRLSAWDENSFVYEDYRHKIDHEMLIASTGISRKGKVKLFEKDSLNLVLRTKAFPGVKCLQFVC